MMEIRTIEQLLDVPPERREELLAALSEWLIWHHAWEAQRMRVVLDRTVFPWKE